MADLSTTQTGTNAATIPILATVLELSAETLNLFGMNPDEPAGELTHTAISSFRHAILSGMQRETISDEVRAEVRNTTWGREAPLPAAPEEDDEDEELEMPVPVPVSSHRPRNTGWAFWLEGSSTDDVDRSNVNDEYDAAGHHYRDHYADTSLAAAATPQGTFVLRGNTATDADGQEVQVFEAWETVPDDEDEYKSDDEEDYTYEAGLPD